MNTPALDDFRSVEKVTLQTFDAALAQQRANAIDELVLADAIDRTVLPPWRDVRTRIAVTVVLTADRELFTTLDRYLAEDFVGGVLRRITNS
ncbi:MAG: hypothetical protein ABJE66_08905 [Deltaproteobacteria bacterium]